MLSNAPRHALRRRPQCCRRAFARRAPARAREEPRGVADGRRRERARARRASPQGEEVEAQRGREAPEGAAAALQSACCGRRRTTLSSLCVGCGQQSKSVVVRRSRTGGSIVLSFVGSWKEGGNSASSVIACLLQCAAAAASWWWFLFLLARPWLTLPREVGTMLYRTPALAYSDGARQSIALRRRPIGRVEVCVLLVGQGLYGGIVVARKGLMSPQRSVARFPAVLRCVGIFLEAGRVTMSSLYN